MVGHTGNLNATIQAVEILDQCLARLNEACQKANAVLIVTADHGNAEQMFAIRKDNDGFNWMPKSSPFHRRSTHSILCRSSWSTISMNGNSAMPAKHRPALPKFGATLLDLRCFPFPLTISPLWWKEGPSLEHRSAFRHRHLPHSSHAPGHDDGRTGG